MTTLYISLDTGGSLLKATASKGKSPPICLGMEPEVIPVIQKPTLHLLDKSDVTRYSWILAGSNQYAVGTLAREEYKAAIPLIKPKIDYFVPRTLAATAAIAHKFNTRNFDLHLSCLLPPSEYKDVGVKALEDELSQALANYSYILGDIKANLRKFSVFPEGLGLLRHYKAHRGEVPSKVAIILFGHRNVSLFELSSGACRNFQSCNLGFASILPKVAACFAQSPRDCLANSATLAVKEECRAKILEYWYSIESWLIETFPSDIEEVVVGGGAVIWIRPQIIDFMKARLPPLSGRDYPGIFFDGGLKDRDWLPEVDLDPSLRVRFADSYLNWRFNYTGKS